MRHVALRFAAFALIAASSTLALASDYAPRTGDRELDLRLTGINELVPGVRDGAIDELVATYGAPRYLVRELLDQRQWSAADVFFACALAYRVRRPCADVAREYEQQPAPGLGTLARGSGMRPGSASFLALKKQLAKSHERLKALAPAPQPAKDETPASAEDAAR